MRCALAVLLCSLAASAQGQQPASPARSITLLDAINQGRQHGVEAAIAQLNARAANARVAERRADLLPNIAGRATFTRQTLNLSEFGIPAATGVTDPFSIFNLQIRATQTVFDASVI